MKSFQKKTFVLFILIAALSLSSIANAATAPGKKEKGALIRWWERIVARYQKEKEDVDKAAIPITGGRVKAEKPEEKKEKEPVVKPRALLSKEKVISAIEGTLEKNPEVIGNIEGLSRKKSMDGSIDYYYQVSGDIPMKLDALDKETVDKLLLKVQQEDARMKSEQLEQRKEDLKKEMPAEEVEEEIVEVDEDERPPRKEIPLTKEQMIESIKRRLKVFSEIEFIIPTLSSRTDEDGNKEYFLKPQDGITVKLQDLDKETLTDLFARVNNEATRINTERLLRQIQQQEQIRRSIPQQPPMPVQPPPQPPTPPPAPPRIFIPPQPPPQPPAPQPTPPAPQPNRR
ncbi:MAG: hypothetical protein WBD00_02900 [Candidatus Omnitrophota bacterium]